MLFIVCVNKFVLVSFLISLKVLFDSQNCQSENGKLKLARDGHIGKIRIIRDCHKGGIGIVIKEKLGLF